MSFSWVFDDGIRVIAIVGICKNAGKTSLLNYLLRARGNDIVIEDVCRTTLRFGVFSTGIDGEERDCVFNTPKPSVILPPETLFCCDSTTLDTLGGRAEVMAALAYPQRDLWIARSLYRLETMITGPASMREQIELSRQMLALGASKILVDGSLDRKSIALSPEVDAVALVLGASYGSLADLDKELKRLLMLAALPVYVADNNEKERLLASGELLLGNQQNWHSSGIETLSGKSSDLSTELSNHPDLDRLYIPGAVTPNSLEPLLSMMLKRPYTLITRHPDCLKMDITSIEKLAARTELKTLIPFRVRGFAINAESIGSASEDAGHFRSQLRKRFPQLDLIDIMEVTYA